MEALDAPAERARDSREDGGRTGLAAGANEAFLRFEEDRTDTRLPLSKGPQARQADQIRAGWLSEWPTPGPAVSGCLGRPWKVCPRLGGPVARQSRAAHGRGLGFLKVSNTSVMRVPSAGRDSAVELLAAYGAYFSRLQRVSTEIGTLRERIETTLSDREIAAVEGTWTRRCREFWSIYGVTARPHRRREGR